jgi:hypothetical protein
MRGLTRDCRNEGRKYHILPADRKLCEGQGFPSQMVVIRSGNQNSIRAPTTCSAKPLPTDLKTCSVVDETEKGVMSKKVCGNAPTEGRL